MHNDDLKNIPMDISFEPLSENLVVDIMQAIDNKTIRRFGAVLNHNKAGYSHNAMLVWQVSEDKIDEIGTLISEHKLVSHCYRRESAPKWPYNLYVMMHAETKEEANATISDLVSKVKSISKEYEFQRLNTLKELKKTSFDPFKD